MGQYKLSIIFLKGFGFSFRIIKGFELEIYFLCFSIFIGLTKEAKGIQLFNKILNGEYPKENIRY